MTGNWSGALLVVRGGTVVREQFSGQATAGMPVRSTTRFQAGSISKQLLAVVALLVAQEDRLGLHEPVSRWLPDLRPELRDVTLHQLLSHTSGLGHWADVPGLDISTPPPRAELDALVRLTTRRDRPGPDFHYSGPGFLLASSVLERATDRSYAELVDERVLGPVGMTSTTSGRWPGGEPDVAAGHQDGEPVDVHPGFTAIPGTGDVWTTTADLVRFSRALHGGELLSPASHAMMWSVHAVIPRDPAADEPRVVESAGAGYGGFTGTVCGRPARFHAGDNPGYRSLLAYLPHEDRHVAVLTNDDGPPLDTPVRLAVESLP